VFACVTLIQGDIGKIPLNLVELDTDGIWHPSTNSAYSPVLRRPNRYQTRQQFVEAWINSKLNFGNTYVLKMRDTRGVVSAMHVLDPTRVRPLIAPDGSVFYGLYTDDLVGLTEQDVAAPASEIMHDRFNCLYHPLIGLPPLYAAALPASQGLNIANNSSGFFANGSQPGGILTAPGAISDDTAKRLKEYWDTNYTGANVGKVAVLGDGLKYEQLTQNAVDSQLIEQDAATKEAICECYHVPKYMVGVGDPPPYGSVEPLLQLYYAQCIQTLLTSFESVLDAGLELDPAVWGTEFDIDDLIWMDTPARVKAASESIGSGAMTPNEARAKYFGLGPVEGGDSCYMQQQMYSLAALAARDAAPPSPAIAPASPDATTDPAFAAKLAAALLKKSYEVVYG
jgi:HK97 family phage portal protein